MLAELIQWDELEDDYEARSCRSQSGRIVPLIQRVPTSFGHVVSLTLGQLLHMRRGARVFQKTSN